MQFLFEKFRRLKESDCGVTAVEYGIIATFIAIALISLISVDGGLGGTLQAAFTLISDTVSEQFGNPG